MTEGNIYNCKILFVSDFLRQKEFDANQILAGERRDILINALNSAGILASDYAFTVIHPGKANGNKITGFTREERISSQEECKKIIDESKANVIVPLGEYALKFITGLDSIQKQHLSLLPVKAEFGKRKALPLLHPETVQRSYSDVAYIRFGAIKLKEEMSTTLLTIPSRKFHLSLDCSFEEQVSLLENIIKNATEVSTDIETGNGYVNTVGLSMNSSEAVVIEAAPGGKTPAQYHKLWELFAKIWSSESIGKIAQNGLFEMTWASIYGIQFNNLIFDTMLAMKFLHPTLERGLDNVGRIYTRFPYWKDDHSDFNNVRDWRSHLIYCGKDSIGQFAAYENQTLDLKARGSLDFFQSFIMKQVPIALEMQNRGFRIDEGTLDAMRHSAYRDIDALAEGFDRDCEKRFGKKININSPKQVKEALKAVGIKLPTAKGKETTSRSAMMKLKNKYPKETMIRDLIKLDQLKKKVDEFLNFEADPDGRVRFSMDLASDENGIWIGKRSIFDRGFDPTQVPSIVKNCIIPDEGKTFVQIRLKQPELRFIATEASDWKLLGMLNEFKDISRYMASKLFRKDEAMVTKNDISVAAQVIKSANEMDAPKQFVEKCFARTGIFYQDAEAKRMMQIYLEEFPGCRSRIERIKKEIYSKRMLRNGQRLIIYYDRVNDSLFRKALAFGPETYSNDEITKLCIQLQEHEGIEFITRNKNSVLLQVSTDSIFHRAFSSLDRNSFEVSYGSRWGSLQNV